MSSKDDPVQVLNHLLVLCSDAAAGYRGAAHAIADPNLRRMLERNAADREEIASVLTYKLVELGHKPAHHGSALGAAHRAWLVATATLDPGDTVALLDACATGERETLAQFSAALGRPLPDDVHAVVQSQLGRVLSASAALQHARSDVEGRRQRAS
jgi:uncharacterized protein (TIGR02284 family)